VEAIVKKLSSGLLLNSLVVVVCILVSADTIRNLVTPARRARPSNKGTSVRSVGPKLNATLTLPGEAWGKSDATIVLALSQGCQFCQASAPFYQRLFAAAHAAAIPVTVVTQDEQPTKTAEFYDHLGLSIPDIRKVSFSEIGVVGTPTLVAVDRAGKITWSRTGQVPEEQEPEVIAFVSHLPGEGLNGGN
jgi:hypothetical protein